MSDRPDDDDKPDPVAKPEDVRGADMDRDQNEYRPIPGAPIGAKIPAFPSDPDDSIAEPHDVRDTDMDRDQNEPEDAALRKRLKANARMIRRGEAFNNDPFMNELAWQADADNALAERGSMAPLFVELNNANKMKQAQERGYAGPEFERFAKRISGVGKDKAHRLRKLDDFALDILRKCESDSAIAKSRGRPYRYPSWNTALNWFAPERKRPQPGAASKVEPESERPKVGDRLPDEEPKADEDRLVGESTAKATVQFLTESLREANESLRHADAENKTLRDDNESLRGHRQPTPDHDEPPQPPPQPAVRPDVPADDDSGKPERAADVDSLRAENLKLQAENLKLQRENAALRSKYEPTTTPDPEPDPPASAPIPDSDPESEPDPQTKQTLSAIAATLTPKQVSDIETGWHLPGFRGRAGENDETIYRLRAAFFSGETDLDALNDPKLLAELCKQSKSFWLHRRERTVAEIIAEFYDPSSDPSPDEPDPDRGPPPEPDPTPDDPDPSPDPSLSKWRHINAAIRKIYAMGNDRTCAKVADVVRQFSIQEWDDNTRHEVAHKLLRAEDWREQYGLGEVYFHYAKAFVLFATVTELLQFDDEHGLQVIPWTEIETMMAPRIAEDRADQRDRQRQQEAIAIRRSKLPRVRKLKAMHERIERFFEINRSFERAAEMIINDLGMKGFDYIRAMKTDDADFAECVTFYDYLTRAVEKVKAQADPAPTIDPKLLQKPA